MPHITAKIERQKKRERETVRKKEKEKKEKDSEKKRKKVRERNEPATATPSCLSPDRHQATHAWRQEQGKEPIQQWWEGKKAMN